MLLAQLSDLHIKAGRRKAYGVVDTASYLEACIAHLLAMDPLPDALLITGDLADHGSDADYALLLELLAPWRALGRPLHVVVGNHDSRDSMCAAFGCSLHGGFLQYAVDLTRDFRLLVLDTVVPGEGAGHLCEARLAWLAHELGADTRKTLIAMHHPPFLSGIGHMDRLGLENRQALEAVVGAHPQIERIVCGHLHRSISVRFGGTVAMSAPSTAHQVALDLRATAPDCFVLEPPGFLLHQWSGTSLISHTVAIGEHAGPYRFRHAGELID